MVGRGEGLHIDADLGDHGLGDVVADAGKIVQPLGGAAKGASAASSRASNCAIVASI